MQADWPWLTSIRYFIRWSPFISLFLIAFACSFPFTRFIDWLIWLPTIVAAWFVPLFTHSEGLAEVSAPSAEQRPPLRLHATSTTLPPVGERILQELTRFRTAEGSDAIRGTLTAEFAPGQRTATLYVAFCPPFERLPDIDVEVDDTDHAPSVSVVQLLHNGAHLEVRLSQPVTIETRINVAFFSAESSDC